jgi:hypothetical protein
MLSNWIVQIIVELFELRMLGLLLEGLRFRISKWIVGLGLR